MVTPDHGPCSTKEAEVQDQINHRFCNWPPGKDEAQKSALFPVFLAELLGWGDYLTGSTDDKHILKEAPGNIINHPLFCKKKNQIISQAKEQYKSTGIFASTNEQELENYFKSKKNPVKEIYDQCKIDLEFSKNDPEKFRATLCGTETDGYLYGLFSNRKFLTEKINLLQSKMNGDQLTNACDKKALNLFESIDVPKSQCLSETTSALSIAQTFVDMVENKWHYPDGLDRLSERGFTNKSGLMTAGSITTYYGTMCDPSNRDLYHSR